MNYSAEQECHAVILVRRLRVCCVGGWREGLPRSFCYMEVFAVKSLRSVSFSLSPLGMAVRHGTLFFTKHKVCKARQNEERTLFPARVPCRIGCHRRLKFISSSCGLEASESAAPLFYMFFFSCTSILFSTVVLVGDALYRAHRTGGVAPGVVGELALAAAEAVKTAAATGNEPPALVLPKGRGRPPIPGGKNALKR